MTPDPAPDPEFQRLIGNVDEELRAQFALREIEVPPQVVKEIAESVATNLDYAFKFEWAPRWEGKRR